MVVLRAETGAAQRVSGATASGPRPATRGCPEHAFTRAVAARAKKIYGMAVAVAAGRLAGRTCSRASCARPNISQAPTPIATVEAIWLTARTVSWVDRPPKAALHVAWRLRDGRLGGRAGEYSARAWSCVQLDGDASMPQRALMLTAGLLVGGWDPLQADGSAVRIRSEQVRGV